MSVKNHPYAKTALTVHLHRSATARIGIQTNHGPQRIFGRSISLRDVQKSNIILLTEESTFENYAVRPEVEEELKIAAELLLNYGVEFYTTVHRLWPEQPILWTREHLPSELSN